MKKKNLIILLIIPFLVSTLTIVSVNLTYNLIDVEVAYLSCDYKQEGKGVNPVKCGETFYLKATPVNNRNADVSKNNKLIWTSSNEECAKVVEENGRYKFTGVNSGDAIITCTTESGKANWNFLFTVYDKGMITVSSAVPQSNYAAIDTTDYFGEYDLKSGKKVGASFPIRVEFFPDSLKNSNPVIQFSDNLSVDISFKKDNDGVFTGTASILGAGNANISVKTDLDDDDLDKIVDYDFVVVEDGVNVYGYDDLLYCTNKSENGEIAVLQKSFESYGLYQSDTSGSSVCFGNRKSDGSFSFSAADKTLYTFETKYNHEFLKQWNEANPSEACAPVINAALRVQKDFYGNGYQINFHNLAYPSSSIRQGDIVIPQLGSDDVFRGPLAFYTVGKPGSSGIFNLITAYGQDNVGLYIDGDNITVSNLKVQNCDDVASLYFLDTVGTVVEVDGDNVSLKNMQMSNGRTVLRSYSCQNLLVDNCKLSNARNFLFMTGANEYRKPDNSSARTFTTPSGTVNYKLSDFLTADSMANTVLTDYINGKINGSYAYTKEQMKTILKELQSALSVNLTREYAEADLYKGSTELHNCQFYRSGITSVAFETLFNGPFLYSSALPGPISTFVSYVNLLIGAENFSPKDISGTSCPVSVNVSGNTRFYDYKTLAEWDISGLVGENVSTIAKEYGGIDYSIDNIFPIKSLLSEVSSRYTYATDGGEYVNMPFAFYGGGNNYSRLTFDGYEEKDRINGSIDDEGYFNENAYVKVDLLDRYLNYPTVNTGALGSIGDILVGMGIEVDHNTLIKTVTLVTGYEPFKFVFTKNDGYLYGQTPQIKDMQAVCQNALLTEVQNA